MKHKNVDLSTEFIQAGFPMIATIAEIPEKKVQRLLGSYGNHSLAIVTIAVI